MWWQGRLAAALCLIAVIAATKDEDHDDYQQTYQGFMPEGWAQSLSNFQTSLGFGKKTGQAGKEEEKRAFSAGSDPSFRKSSFVKSSSSSYSSSGGGIKSSNRAAGSLSTTDSCSGDPPTPFHSTVRCSQYSGCQATCKRNYKFPSGEDRIYFTCENGEWRVKGSDWTTIPHCQPTCLPECQNNGICVAPNQCNCPDTFSGPYCQYESKPCLNYPPVPMNSRRSCTSKSCTVQCVDGHKFHDGSSITNLMCQNGVWTPSKPGWTSIPDCEPVCDPPCSNGGKCLSFNKCQCPVDFRGPQCQYSADSCNMKKMEFNGGRNCTGNSDTFSCVIYCPPGINFAFPPATLYTCSYSTGVFIPSPIPQCQFPANTMVKTFSGSSSYSQHSNSSWSKSSFKSKGFKSGSSSFGMSMEDLIAKFSEVDTSIMMNLQSSPGTCFTWGGSHYKTFDGKLYSFLSQCSYTLVRDAADNTYTVNLETDRTCKGSDTCSKKLKIYVENKEFSLGLDSDGKPELKDQNSKLIKIPSQVSELSVQLVHNFVLVKLNGVGTSIKWDTKDFISVDVTEKLWNKTAGLCGRIDGYNQNDFEMKNGKRENSLIPFVNSWEVEALGDRCNEQAIESHPCGDTSSAEITIATQANDFCSKIKTDSRFAPCLELKEKLNVNAFYESCRWDYCLGKSKNSPQKACEAVSAFVRECLRLGVTLPNKWRDEFFCPMSCSNGTVYTQCGPAAQPTCRSAAVTADQRAEFCVEGCFCPEGLVLNNDICIPQEQCPCQYRGKVFNNGATLNKGCNTCTCNGGQWSCTEVLCGARCAAVGDPHYVTFDGKRYDFMGKCSYYLMKTNNFSIEAENVACAGSISETLGFAIGGTSGLPSCTKTLTIHMDKTVIKLKQNHEVVLNGEEVLKLPVKTQGISIRSLSSIFLVVELASGVEVWWDGLTRAYIDVPASFHGQTQGLCGTFNANQNDDFLTPEGDIEQSVEAFANKWKTQETCEDIKEKDIANPCDKNMQNKGMAESHCAKLKGKSFSACHWLVDVEPYYQDCLYDVCSCQGKVGACLCPIMSGYAKECAANGVNVDWRHEVRECGVHCSGSQRYQVCGDSCSRSCKDISYNPKCKSQCVEGCNCPNGQTLDKNGECVAVAECPCIYNDVEYEPGHREIRPGTDGLELCTCSSALWKCHPASSDEIKEYPPQASNLIQECSAAQNFEFTKCEPAEPVTCKNMHESVSNTGTSPAVCRSGCKCKKGYVLDSVSKTCILPSKCPCHHGGKSYGEGETMQENCNVCTCQAGSWTCTDRICAGICSSWGESHFKTFDGKIYDFQGNCDYMLAHGKTSKSDAFEVSIQNVMCGSSGVTCAKSVSIRVGSGNETESVVLTKDKPVPNFLGLKRITVRQAGLFVFVEVFDLGLVVQWDRGTRAYVKIDPKWKNRLKGLCGNYNDNQMDDFQTPSGGMTEVSARLFGDSWRLQPYCVESTDILDTCVLHPNRKTWAMQKCGILKSDIFRPCHSEIPVGPYLERCMFDTCGCDLGGDCECLCTAISAYAQECNTHGVPIKWRTQELCPIQCDENCAHYSPCVATCPKETCSNMFLYKSMTQMCSEDSCVEGCQLKPCPKGEIYNNLDDLKCVPKSECKTVCLTINGKNFYEGDLIKQDQCHSCFCSHHKEVCRGEPCTSTTEYRISTPATTTQELEATVTDEPHDQFCIPGWSKWISNDKPKKFKSHNDVELLTNPIKFKRLKQWLPCGSEHMVDIKCRTVGTHMHYKETGQDVECSLQRGLKCAGTPVSPCLDYEISVFCKCVEEETSTTESTTTTTTTKLPPIIVTIPPPMTCTPGWTEWMDSNKPDSEGEFEKTEVLRQSHSFCADYMILETQCRTVNTHEDSKVSDMLSLCDHKGLRCKNKGRGDMMCQNYEIRFLCACDCQNAMGMEDGTLETSQISVSSFSSPSTLGDQARLNGAGAWVPDTSKAKHWIQVSFGEAKNITGLDVQGHPTKEEWVESFTVSYSLDGETWTYVKEKDSNWPKKLEGNKDKSSVVRVIFSESIIAQYIRIHPTFFHNVPALRFEILGCDVTKLTTTEPPTLTTITTSRPPPVAPCITSEWTPWMSSHKPGPGDWDEIEDYTSLRSKYPFCESSFITKIKCRTANNHVTVDDAGQAGVTCNLNEGLQCNGRLQAPSVCFDYEVSFFCDCPGRYGKLCDPEKPRAHETDCNKYYQCSESGESGEMEVVMNCGPHMMFSTKTFKCDWIKNVFEIRPECASTTTTTLPPVTTTSSVCDPETKHRAHETDCHKYYQCSESGESGEKDMVLHCGPHMMFSTKTFECDWNKSVLEIRPECSEGTTPATTPRPDECDPAKPNTPHESDCHKFYQCVDDVKVVKDCGKYMLYNVQNMICDWPSNVLPLRPECKETSTTIMSTTVTPAPPAVVCIPGWSEWFNTTHPETDSGDYELISDIRESGGKICLVENIKKIQCKYYDDTDSEDSGSLKTKKSRSKRAMKDFKESGDIVTCKKRAGLSCNNAQQLNSICHDYAIRVFCECEEVPTSTPTTVTSTSTTPVVNDVFSTSVCPPGQRWYDCAIPCELVCHSYHYDLTQKGLCSSAAGCKSGCVGEEAYLMCHSNPGFMWRSPDKCIREADCTCVLDDGQIVKPGTVFIQNSCERCQCIKNRFICDKTSCTSSVPEITTDVYTEPPVTKATAPPPVDSHENCLDNGWTLWKSQSTPSSQMNEEETFNQFVFDCEPIDIQCRTVRDSQDWTETGQILSCDTYSGLKCKNVDNLPEGCMDYEIRVKCKCQQETTPSPTEPSPDTTIGTVTSPVACEGWSQWFNDKNPEVDGLDREGKLTIELIQNGFCQNGEITDIDCVVAKSGKTYTTTDDKDVTCTLDSGLLCHNADQDRERQCNDYKIRYYCSCDRVTSTTILTSVIPTFSPPMLCDDSKYIELVNGEVPLADTAFTASSSVNSLFGPHKGRISPPLDNGYELSWVAREEDLSQFLQVDLGRVEPVYGTIVQGNSATNQRVTSYHVQYSRDKLIFTYAINENGDPQVFRGPTDSSEKVQNMFYLPFEARYIRFKPQTWQNGIAMKVDIIGCGDVIFSTSTSHPTSTTIFTTTSGVEVLCDDKMGLENGMLNDQQIEVSSVLDNNQEINGPKNIRIGGLSAWRPYILGNHEWVMIDFTGPRNISGIITQGDEVQNTWVETYTVQYSHDNINWNKILDSNMKEMIFPGNFDSKSLSTSTFNRMINAQYLKIIPEKWHKAIGLRLEIIGCYLSYPAPPTTTRPPSDTTNPPDTIVECDKTCPNLPEEYRTKYCEICTNDEVWNGQRCIKLFDCDCYVGLISYPVGTVYEKDCKKCTCKFGGMSECEEQECAKCEDGLQSVSTPNCACVCKPCPDGTRLCPTSNVCVNISQWCDGIEDCPDDERQCITTPTTTLATTPAECPPAPFCDDGFTLVEKKKSQETASFSKKGGVKGGRRFKPARLVECPEYECMMLTTTTTMAPCPAPDCPPGYNVIKKTLPDKPCPTFICKPIPKEQECKIEEKFFKTFDDTRYEYVICDHVLAQDKENNEWNITVKQICSELNDCRKHLVVSQGTYQIKFRPDLSIEYDGYTYDVEQAQTIGSKHQEFLISRLGNSIFFDSNHYGFKISFGENGDIKISIPPKLSGHVNGLCGFFNGEQSDDMSKPDGSLVRSSQEFGDSWSVPGSDLDCRVVTCPQVYQNKALHICSAISTKTPLNQCTDVETLAFFIQTCIESVCNCLEHDTEDKCRCDATLTFMKECQAKQTQLDLSSWRVEYNCLAACPPGLVYKDCYKHSCERSCSNLMDKGACPALENACFSGCYCPDGLVRKGEKCVKPNECKDCVCDGFGDPQYLSFDRTNYTFNGNCTYVASRDISTSGKHTYQVLVTNVECIDEPGTTCTDALTVLYNNHIIHVNRVEGKKQIIARLDRKIVTTFPVENDWLKLEKLPGKSVTIHIPAIQLEVTYFYFNYAFNIRLPSQTFVNKTEGLCGNCNKDKTDDLKTLEGEITDNIDDFGMSWLVKKLPPGMPIENGCMAPPKNECLPLPPDEDPCLWIMDEDKFGKCHALVDPESFIIACQFDVCHSANRLTTACKDVEAYAHQCQSHGVCLNWRSDGLCPYDCPSGMLYKACEKGCSRTCDNFEQIKKETCEVEPAEGCFCPEGEVLKDGKCVPESKCKPCDSEGHYLGDEWKPNNCTTCECTIPFENSTDVSIRCKTMECPAKETVCKQNYEATMISGTEHDCCPKYRCIEKNITKESCPLLNAPNCGPYQEVKDISTDDSCPILICQCIPVEKCLPMATLEDELVIEAPGLDYGGDTSFTNEFPKLDEGMVRLINKSGCCPHVSQECRKETCPKIECQEFFTPEVVSGTESLCCPKQTCVPPKDVCLYGHKYIAQEKGGERLRTESEKKIEIKEIGAKWSDGPCSSCECVARDSPTSVCNKRLCPSIEESSDFKDYVLDEQPRVGECCPIFKRTACRLEGREFAIGEELPVPSDKCSTESCVKLDDGTVQKQIRTEKCVTDCEKGWEYIHPDSDSTKCCGQCKQVGCFVDDEVHASGSSWHSQDRCTHYFCISTNGTLQVEAIRTKCPKIPDEILKDFVVDTYTLPGQCCNETEKVACIHDGKQYETGQAWPSTGDKCKTYLCSRNDKGEVVKQEQVEICKKDCEKGWTYKEPLSTSNVCCGHCVQESCIVGGGLKNVGEQWTSQDNCTTSYCERTNSQVQVFNSTKVCPALENCKPGTIQLSDDGCCEVCEPAVANLQECDAIKVDEVETVGMVTELKDNHGKCMNRKPIPEFKECNGFCQSRTHYNPYKSSHVSDCKCCQPQVMATLQVEVTCEDDHTYIKSIKVPESCTCTICEGSDSGVKKTSIKKSPIKRDIFDDLY